MLWLNRRGKSIKAAHGEVYERTLIEEHNRRMGAKWHAHFDAISDEELEPVRDLLERDMEGDGPSDAELEAISSDWGVRPPVRDAVNMVSSVIVATTRRTATHDITTPEMAALTCDTTRPKLKSRPLARYCFTLQLNDGGTAIAT